MPACHALLLAFVLLLMPVHVPARTITMVAVEWPPYTAAQAPGNGILSQLVRKALLRKGHTLEVVFTPWVRALEMVRTGQCDGIIGVAPSEERLQYMHMAQPLVRHEGVLFRLATTSAARFETLQELCPARVGVLRGSIYHAAFNTAKCLNIIDITTPEQGVRMLLAGRIDYQIEDPLFMADMLTTFPIAERKALQAMHPPVAYSATTAGFSRAKADGATLARDFSDAIAELGDTGIHAAMLSPHGLSLPPDSWHGATGHITVPH